MFGLLNNNLGFLDLSSLILIVSPWSFLFFFLGLFIFLVILVRESYLKGLLFLISYYFLGLLILFIFSLGSIKGLLFLSLVAFLILMPISIFKRLFGIKSNKKKEIVIIILILFLLMASYLIYNYLLRNLNPKIGLEYLIERQIRINDWKTYKNEEYRVEFKYDNSAKIIQESNDRFYISLPISETETNLSEKTFILSFDEISRCDYGLTYYNKEVKIDDVIFKKEINNTGGNQTVSYTETYEAKINDKCVRLVFSLNGDRYSLKSNFIPEKETDELTQIISTFKFID